MGSSLPQEVLTTLGFFALTTALYVGHTTPARAYELSIYAATPAQFWVGLGLAAAVGIMVSFSRRAAPVTRSLGCLLIAGSLVAVAAIPVIRGYHFFGPGDSLTHLGWTRDIATGALNPVDLLYPGLHTTSLLIGELAGLPVEYSLELVIIIFVTMFVAFVPVVVSYLAEGIWVVPVAIICAGLFIPINNASVFRMAHPATQTILLSPFVVYLLIVHLEGSKVDTDSFLRRPSRTDLLIAIAGLSAIMLHPQIALSLIVAVAAMATLQVLAQVRRSGSLIANHRLLVGHTLFLSAAFVLLTEGNARARRSATATLQAFVDFFTGSTTPADGAAARSASVADIGGSIEVLFLKLFGVSAVLCVITAILTILVLYRGYCGSQSTADTYLTYLIAGSVSVTMIFAFYFLSSVSTQYFRQLGFLMVFVTLIAAAGITRFTPDNQPDSTSERDRVLNTQTASQLIVVGIMLVLIVLLVASLYSFYRAPYIYTPSDQVPEGHIEGMEAAFERMDQNQSIRSIRLTGGLYRYQDGIYGVDRSRSMNIKSGYVEPRAFNSGNYTGYYNESHYMAMTERDAKRELIAFKELHFERAGADRLDSHRRLDRVVSNGQVRVYYVSIPENASNETG